jgi:DNA repair exonuclease SbcCD ATPase subunit
MGPKKGGKKGGKKDSGGGGEDGGTMDAETQAKMFMMTCQSLQLQLADRTEDASRALAQKRELQARVEQMSTDLEDNQRGTFEITQDMTRQYKGMQEELLSRINNLEETIQELNDKLTDATINNERITKDKDAIIKMKDDEISELKSKMDDMAEEFGEMLRETLEKMRERIEVSSGQVDAMDMPIKNRIEELKLGD